MYFRAWVRQKVLKIHAAFNPAYLTLPCPILELQAIRTHFFPFIQITETLRSQKESWVIPDHSYVVTARRGKHTPGPCGFSELLLGFWPGMWRPSLKSTVAKGDGGNGEGRGGHAQLGSLGALPSHRGPWGQKVRMPEMKIARPPQMGIKDLRQK